MYMSRTGTGNTVFQKRLSLTLLRPILCPFLCYIYYDVSVRLSVRPDSPAYITPTLTLT